MRLRMGEEEQITQTDVQSIPSPAALLRIAGSISELLSRRQRSPRDGFATGHRGHKGNGFLTRVDEQLSDLIIMKAIQIRAHGGPEVLKLEECPIPEIASDEVLIRVHAAGGNFIDVYQRTGLYKVALPLTPGMEGSGVVEKAGAQTALKPGDRVAWTQHPGGFAEYAAVPAWKTVIVPEDVDDRSAAAALLQGITAQYLCETTYPVK